MAIDLEDEGSAANGSQGTDMEASPPDQSLPTAPSPVDSPKSRQSWSYRARRPAGASSGGRPSAAHRAKTSRRAAVASWSAGGAASDGAGKELRRRPRRRLVVAS
ncbi:hypothetical protein ZWY2020_015335 [Hordeum vulgare]|nr:hypothetical protein ZWY2020_015335 [Hordeum vulgare]